MLAAGRRRRRGAGAYRLLGAVVASSVLAGCSPTPPNEPATATPLATSDVVASARELLAGAGLKLPTSADGVEVDAVTDDLFSEVTVARFSAPRAAGADVCLDVNQLYGAMPLIPTYEAELLGIATPSVEGSTPLPDGTESCSFSLDARRQVRVLVGAGDPAPVEVLLFRFPPR